MYITNEAKWQRLTVALTKMVISPYNLNTDIVHLK